MRTTSWAWASAGQPARSLGTRLAPPISPPPARPALACCCRPHCRRTGRSQPAATYSPTQAGVRAQRTFHSVYIHSTYSIWSKWRVRKKSMISSQNINYCMKWQKRRKSNWVQIIQFSSVLSSSVQYSSCRVQLNSVQGSVRFSSAQFSSVLFGLVQFGRFG